MFAVLLWNLFLFVAGAVTVMISAWWWIINQESPTVEHQKPTVTTTNLPNVLADKLKQGIGLHRRETCFALNLILQFFFQEKRYEAGIIRWLTNMLTLEFSELLKHKTLSKIIHNMQIRDLSLGTNFPVIRAVTVKHVNLNPESSNLEQIDILVQLEYNGGIQLAVDASSRFSKSAMVKIKVVHLSGNGRLQFSRYPFTHWSFSFYEEPQVEFEVYSSLGLHIPRFNAIIISQLRGVLKRKHTLPYFKLRGPPLVKRQMHPANEEGCSVPPGRLIGEVVRCTRLQSDLVDDIMYCTVMVSDVPIICAKEKSIGLCIVLDMTLKRPHGSSAGILLHNAEEGTPVVESVHHSSPAYAAGLRKNDVLLAVNGTYLSSSQQAAKLFSTGNTSGDVDNITLRVKRVMPLDQKKMSTEQKPVCSDGATPVTGEDPAGEVCGSGRSTPDSSHNNSPELKRKVLELQTLTVDLKPSVLSQDRSPVTSKVQEKSGLGAVNQNFSPPASNEIPPSNQSSKAGTPTSEINAPPLLEKRPGRKHVHKNKPHIKIIQTATIEGIADPVFNSEFEFWLEEENKYLNIAVWSKSDSSKQDCDVECVDKNVDSKLGHREKEKEKKKAKDNEKSKYKEDRVLADVAEDTLVGYVNMPIISLIPETTLNTQGHAVRILTLKPPHPKCPEVMADPLNAHKGFDKNLCYGDIMLSLTYQPHDRCDMPIRISQDKAYNRPLSEDESLTDGTVSEEEDTFVMQDVVEDRIHDFKRTHFQSAVQCDFCRKKIWLKDAYQCGECGIVCHKKCMVRCEQETVCDISGLRFREPSKLESQEPQDSKETPEIITTAASGSTADSGSPGHTPPVSPHSHRRTLSSLFAQVASASKGSLKRAGSANNLAPPNSSHDGTHSRSLPPSPPHSPHHSRKASISEGVNPFVVDFSEGDSIESVLDRLLLFPHDENLVTLARESAINLYSTLPGKERREKINSTLMELQVAVDHEGEVRVDLARQERDASEAGDDLTRASVALQISQCDARTQALALLTLHYCTALQHSTTEAEVSEHVPEVTQ